MRYVPHEMPHEVEMHMKYEMHMKFEMHMKLKCHMKYEMPHEVLHEIRVVSNLNCIYTYVAFIYTCLIALSSSISSLQTVSNSYSSFFLSLSLSQPLFSLSLSLFLSP